MFCTKCGSVAQEGAVFCRTCGGPIATPSSVLTGNAVVAAVPPPSMAGSVPPISPVTASPVASYNQPVAPVYVSLSGPYAGFWLRLVAHLIDGAIATVVFGLVVAITVATVGTAFFRGFTPGAYDRPPNTMFPAAVLGVFLVLLPIMIVVTWLYFALMEASAHQGTFGKMALGLFVTDLQGQRVSFGRASGRFFARFITGLIPLALGYIMAGFTEKKQALHDLIASCLVLKKV